MRTTLDLDADLLRDAMGYADGKSKKALIEEALREFVNARRRQELIEMIGTHDIDMTPEELRRFRGCDAPRLSD